MVRPRCPSARELVHCLGKLHVKLGQAAGIMGRERDLYILVDVEPFRMMVELFCDQRSAGHEPESLIEIGKNEFLADRIAALDFAPALKACERAFAGFAGK